MTTPSITDKTRDYYNSDHVVAFHDLAFGSRDICSIGLYETPKQPILAAMQKTVQHIATWLRLESSSQVLDIGAGYGGAARYLARQTGCSVTCLNLSSIQNQRNQLLNQQQQLADQIEVVEGSFDAIPFPDNCFDGVYSQDALLFSSDRYKVFQEVYRVLKPGSSFVFCDPMQQENCPAEKLQPILQRLHLDSLATISSYCTIAADVGLTLIQFIERPEQLVRHYGRLLAAINTRYTDFVAACGEAYTEHQRVGLNHWIEAGQQGYLNWGILQFAKPSDLITD